MKTSQELERELKEAKLQEKLNNLNKDLSSVKEQYEGKAFGDRMFERNSKTGYEQAFYFEKFFIEKEQILGIIWRVNRNRCGKNWKFSADNYTYSRSKGEQQLGYENKSVFSTIFDMICYTKAEISVEKFLSLYNSCMAAEEHISKAWKENISEIYIDQLRIGTSNEERQLEVAIEKIGIQMIDITKFPKIFEELKYRTLPMFQNQRFIPKLFAKQILDYQISLWKEEKNNRFLRYEDVERLDRKIDLIQQFIKNETI